MEILKVQDLNFEYADGGFCLENINFSVEKGSFVTVCGMSGSGKSTLLRILKPELSTQGSVSGEVLLYGKDVHKASFEENVFKIGYVMQNPIHQCVTDTVRHELEFGLINAGLPGNVIERRCAEAAMCFGIDGYFDADIKELSGGQLKIVELAAVMALKPDVILLDEPVAQLDPMAAHNFLDILRRINKDYGVTVIAAEHILEEILTVSDELIVMDNGRIAMQGNTGEVIRKICGLKEKHPESTLAKLTDNLSYSAKVYGEYALSQEETSGYDFTVNAAVKLLQRPDETKKRKLCEKKQDTELQGKKQHSPAEQLLKLKNVWFRYTRDGKDILKGMDFEMSAGSIVAMMGGNGAGKTTAIRCMTKALKPYSGKVIYAKKNISAGYLPQDTETAFVTDKIISDFKISGADFDTATENYKELRELRDKHPYDVSAGQLQKLALLKLAYGKEKPDILFLDEPGKTLDGFSKKQLCDMLKEFKKDGIAVLMVTHDIELVSSCADRCIMMFDGHIVSEDVTDAFLNENIFFTTDEKKIQRLLTV